MLFLGSIVFSQPYPEFVFFLTSWSNILPALLHVYVFIRLINTEIAYICSINVDYGLEVFQGFAIKCLKLLIRVFKCPLISYKMNITFLDEHFLPFDTSLVFSVEYRYG